VWSQWFTPAVSPCLSELINGTTFKEAQHQTASGDGALRRVEISLPTVCPATLEAVLDFYKTGEILLLTYVSEEDGDKGDGSRVKLPFNVLAERALRLILAAEALMVPAVVVKTTEIILQRLNDLDNRGSVEAAGEAVESVLCLFDSYAQMGDLSITAMDDGELRKECLNKLLSEANSWPQQLAIPLCKELLKRLEGSKKAFSQAWAHQLLLDVLQANKIKLKQLAEDVETPFGLDLLLHAQTACLEKQKAVRSNVWHAELFMAISSWHKKRPDLTSAQRLVNTYVKVEEMLHSFFISQFEELVELAPVQVARVQAKLLVRVEEAGIVFNGRRVCSSDIVAINPSKKENLEMKKCELQLPRDLPDGFTSNPALLSLGKYSWQLKLQVDHSSEDQAKLKVMLRPCHPRSQPRTLTLRYSLSLCQGVTAGTAPISIREKAAASFQLNQAGYTNLVEDYRLSLRALKEGTLTLQMNGIAAALSGGSDNSKPKILLVGRRQNKANRNERSDDENQEEEPPAVRPRRR